MITLSSSSFFSLLLASPPSHLHARRVGGFTSPTTHTAARDSPCLLNPHNNNKSVISRSAPSPPRLQQPPVLASSSPPTKITMPRPSVAGHTQGPPTGAGSPSTAPHHYCRTHTLTTPRAPTPAALRSSAPRLTASLALACGWLMGVWGWLGGSRGQRRACATRRDGPNSPQPHPRPSNAQNARTGGSDLRVIVGDVVPIKQWFVYLWFG